MKKIFTLVAFLMNSVSVFADESAPAKFWDDPFNHPLMPFYLMIAFVFVVIILLFVVTLVVLRVLKMFEQQAAKEKAVRSTIATVAGMAMKSWSWKPAAGVVVLSMVVLLLLTR